MERNAGGTQRDLSAVLAGPAEAVDGVRVLCALRFDDGVSLLLQRENGVDAFEDDPRDFELVDDVGTTYSPGGGSGGPLERRILVGTDTRESRATRYRSAKTSTPPTTPGPLAAP